MKFRRSRSIALLAALLAGMAASVQADEAQRLEGSWTVTITAAEPPGLPPLKSLITFTRDGEVIESRRPYIPFTPFGPVLETSGHGAWVRTGRRQFAVA